MAAGVCLNRATYFIYYSKMEICCFNGFVSSSLSVDHLFSFGTDGIAWDLIAMFLTGITAYAILIVIELGAFKILKMFILKIVRRGNSNANSNTASTERIDDDVLAEKLRIEQMTNIELQSQAMVLKNVSKNYGQFEAVENVSFSIDG